MAQQKVCRKAGRRNNNRQSYHYQLISGLTGCNIFVIGGAYLLNSEDISKNGKIKVDGWDEDLEYFLG